MDMMERQKMIIDTDCGIDDAVAIMLTLSSKDVAEIVAITCCFGNTSLDKVCSNVKRVLTVCEEKEIPIHRGCEGPLIKRQSPATVHGSDGLGDCAHGFSTGGLEESEIPAAVAMISLARKHPKEITVIAIGPLTNLALAHRMDSAFTEKLKSIIIMGGNYKGTGNVTEVAEFNFFSDPESANIIVQEAKCHVVLVPWETAMEYGIPWEWYDELNLYELNTPKSKFFKNICDFLAKFPPSKGKKQLLLPDILPVIAVLYPHYVTSSFVRDLRVECDGEFTRGMTILMRDPTCNSNPVCVITGYDMEFLNSTLKKMLS